MKKPIFALASLTLVTLLGSGCSDQSTQSGVDSGSGVDLSTSGTPDLASAGPDMANGPLSCSGYVYCENFEAYNGAVANAAKLGPWVATVTGTGNTMVVDSVRPYSGSKSLHITVPAGAPSRNTLNQVAQGGLIPGNNMYGRAMVYYSNSGTNGLAIGVHSWIFQSDGVSTKVGGTAVASMNMGGGGAKFQLNYHPPSPPAPAGTEYSQQGGTQTAGKWMCVQWEYDGSGSPAKDEGKVWVDGVLALDVVNQNPIWDFATPWTSMDFGFNHYQTTTNPIDIYLDDFALNNTMIPCPP